MEYMVFHAPFFYVDAKVKNPDVDIAPPKINQTGIPHTHSL
jgi:hypothetical protein